MIDTNSIITDSIVDGHKVFGEQVVAIREGGLKIGALGSTNLKQQAGKGVPVSAVVYTNKKSLFIGYEDGSVTLNGTEVHLSSSKITGLC